MSQCHSILSVSGEAVASQELRGNNFQAQPHLQAGFSSATLLIKTQFPPYLSSNDDNSMWWLPSLQRFITNNLHLLQITEVFCHENLKFIKIWLMNDVSSSSLFTHIIIITIILASSSFHNHHHNHFNQHHHHFYHHHHHHLRGPHGQIIIININIITTLIMLSSPSSSSSSG